MQIIIASTFFTISTFIFQACTTKLEFVSLFLIYLVVSFYAPLTLCASEKKKRSLLLICWVIPVKAFFKWMFFSLSACFHHEKMYFCSFPPSFPSLHRDSAKPNSPYLSGHLQRAQSPSFLCASLPSSHSSSIMNLDVHAFTLMMWW